MVARLDHLTIVAPSLDVGCDYVEAALGARPGAGRAHPGMATHNRLLALGAEVHLEVISPDPLAAPVTRPRWFGLDHVHAGSPPRLAAWVANTDDMARAAVPALGAVETMRREHHTWQMTVRPDGRVPLDGAAPLLIQRSSPGHPAASLPPSGLHLRELRIRHPSPADVLALFARIGLAPSPAVTVAQGGECSLLALIETPHGLRELGRA
jgi:hypothetical protein